MTLSNKFYKIFLSIIHSLLQQVVQQDYDKYCWPSTEVKMKRWIFFIVSSCCLKNRRMGIMSNILWRCWIELFWWLIRLILKMFPRRLFMINFIVLVLICFGWLKKIRIVELFIKFIIMTKLGKNKITYKAINLLIFPNNNCQRH